MMPLPFLDDESDIFCVCIGNFNGFINPVVHVDYDDDYYVSLYTMNDSTLYCSDEFGNIYVGDVISSETVAYDLLNEIAQVVERRTGASAVADEFGKIDYNFFCK